MKIGRTNRVPRAVIGAMAFIAFLVACAACSGGDRRKAPPFPADIEAIEARLNEYVADENGAPNIEIVYRSTDSVTWRFIAGGDSLRYIREAVGEPAQTVYATSMWEGDFDNMRQLVAALNPHTLPYRYGAPDSGKASLLILIESDTILMDNDFRGSVVPSEMIQIYRYMHRPYEFESRNYPDFPPAEYGRVRMHEERPGKADD